MLITKRSSEGRNEKKTFLPRGQYISATRETPPTNVVTTRGAHPLPPTQTLTLIRVQNQIHQHVVYIHMYNMFSHDFFYMYMLYITQIFENDIKCHHVRVYTTTSSERPNITHLTMYIRNIYHVYTICM